MVNIFCSWFLYVIFYLQLLYLLIEIYVSWMTDSCRLDCTVNATTNQLLHQQGVLPIYTLLQCEMNGNLITDDFPKSG